MAVIDFKGLQKASGKRSRNDVMRWLKENHIPFILDEHNRPKTVADWLPEAAESPSADTAG